MPKRPKQELFAVVRIDASSQPDSRVSDRLSVTAVFPTMGEAIAEVERLNTLNRDKGSTYLWRSTRFYPEGRPPTVAESRRPQNTAPRKGTKQGALADHTRIGGRFIPPFTSMMGVLDEVRWLERPLPELLWLALLNRRHGYERGAALALSLAKAASEVADRSRKGWFAITSVYETLLSDERRDLLRTLESKGDLDDIRDGLSLLFQYYPLCPLTFLLGDRSMAVQQPQESLSDFKTLLGSLFDKTSTPAVRMQSNALYIAFVTDLLKVAGTTSLAKFPAVADYPHTAESQRIASSVRAATNALIGAMDYHSEWPRYFWNRGLEIEPCPPEVRADE